MKKLLIIHTYDSVYDYYLGIDAETHEEIFRKESERYCSIVNVESLAREYGYYNFKSYEL